MAESNRNKDKAERVNLKKGSFKKSLKIFHFFDGQKKLFVLGLLFLLLSSITSLVFPKYMGDLINASKEADYLSEIKQIAIILFIIFGAQSIFSFFRIYLFAVVTEKSLAKLRQHTYATLVQQPMEFFSKKRIGELSSRISADIALLQETFTTTLAEFFRQIITIFGGIAYLFYISWKLTLFMLALLPIVAIVAVVFGRFIKKLSKLSQEKIAESNTIVEETLQGISNVKSFANEAYEIMRYNNSTNDVISYSLKSAKYRGAFVSFIIFAVFGTIVAIVWYASILVAQGTLNVGLLLSFILYTVLIGASFGSIADLWAKIQKAIGATEQLIDTIEEPIESLDTELNEFEKINGNIKVSNLNFEYPSRKNIQVLKNLNFDVKQGETIAIVGSSGSGKSTLISLLLRFYDANSGGITINNKDITNYPLTALRKQIGVVHQDVLLFGGSIKENIAYGKIGATDSEIIEAAKQANAHDFIESFPEGYETLVGDRGIKLSGGQRQRVAIARAVLKNPNYLILDEATSALDSESEVLVQNAIEKLMQNRTSIVVAHRLSTIRKANKIIVLEKGEIVEQGTHNELMQISKGNYNKMYSLQSERV